MKLSLAKRQNLTGWLFLLPASVLIAVMSFYPMIQAFFLSLNKGRGNRLSFAGLVNYKRLLIDPIFWTALKNTCLYLVIQVPIMLILAIVLAVLLNNPALKFRGLFRTAIFLPCAMSLVSYAIVFRTLFAVDGFVNYALLKFGWISEAVNWLANPVTAKLVIVLALLWRWTGYNMIFFLAGLQNIGHNLYEAAKIDGANSWQCFWRITIPLLRPMILLTAIMSTNGTLQLFDESINLTRGGPGNATITLSHYIYKTSFEGAPNFPYASAMSYVIFILVAILAFVQLKAGDRRD